jgi:L-fucose mutarotase
MLKGVDPRLGPDLLAILRAMGHGDEIALVDANFPAQGVARRLCRADGVDVVTMARAVVSLMPLDDFVDSAAFSMAVVDASSETPAVVAELRTVLRAAGYEGEMVALERHAFYERARAAYVVVATGELRLYGNVILVKGVVRPS